MPTTGAPSTQTPPALGRSVPASTLSSVDLPQPLGPTMARNSRSCTVRSRPSTARTTAPPRSKSTRSPSKRTALAGGASAVGVLMMPALRAFRRQVLVGRDVGPLDLLAEQPGGPEQVNVGRHRLVAQAALGGHARADVAEVLGNR